LVQARRFQIPIDLCQILEAELFSAMGVVTEAKIFHRIFSRAKGRSLQPFASALSHGVLARYCAKMLIRQSQQLSFTPPCQSPKKGKLQS
jgi:hypothetical protein